MLIARIATLVAAALLVFIGWRDFRTFKIRNAAVLAMAGLYAVRALAVGGEGLAGDLAAGGLLFGLGVVMWLAGAMGAGDAKLLLPLGLLLSFEGLVPFCALLSVVSVLLFLAIRVAERLPPGGAIRRWLAGIGRAGKVPYGLVLAMAGCPVLVARAIWGG